MTLYKYIMEANSPTGTPYYLSFSLQRELSFISNMSSKMGASEILRMKRRSKLKNEANSLKIKRKSSTEKDVGSLRQKEEHGHGLYVGDDNDDFYVNQDYDDDDIDDVDKVDYSDDDNAGDTEKHDEKHSHCRVTHGFHLVEGKMNHGMEDYIVAENRRANGYKLGLYAIFDGHSGCSVAEYLQSHLFDRILNEPDFWTQPKAAIRRAYGDTDNEILEKVVGSRGGSTAVTAILINQEKLIVANVGDSRAVICRSGSAKQITVDHDPQKEKKLIESRGGFVSQKPGNIPRVDGQLAMTRAFGDERLKEHITAEPDIVLVTIDADTEFIILASDGLWKVMSNQEAADCIIDLADAQEASEKLIREALARNSRDDISCIVVMFQ